MRFQKPLDPLGKLSASVDAGPATGSGPISRRQFAVSAGAATLCAPLAAAEPPGREQRMSRPDGLSLTAWDEVQARYQNVLRTYGSRLSTQQRQVVLRVLVTNQHMLTSIQSFIVQNGDPSACTLRLVTTDSATT